MAGGGVGDGDSKCTRRLVEATDRSFLSVHLYACFDIDAGGGDDCKSRTIGGRSDPVDVSHLGGATHRDLNRGGEHVGFRTVVENHVAFSLAEEAGEKEVEYDELIAEPADPVDRRRAAEDGGAEADDGLRITGDKPEATGDKAGVDYLGSNESRAHVIAAVSRWVSEVTISRGVEKRGRRTARVDREIDVGESLASGDVEGLGGLRIARAREKLQVEAVVHRDWIVVGVARKQDVAGRGLSTDWRRNGVDINLIGTGGNSEDAVSSIGIGERANRSAVERKNDYAGKIDAVAVLGDATGDRAKEAGEITRRVEDGDGSHVVGGDGLGARGGAGELGRHRRGCEGVLEAERMAEFMDCVQEEGFRIAGVGDAIDIGEVFAKDNEGTQDGGEGRIGVEVGFGFDRRAGIGNNTGGDVVGKHDIDSGRALGCRSGSCIATKGQAQVAGRNIAPGSCGKKNLAHQGIRIVAGGQPLLTVGDEEVRHCAMDERVQVELFVNRLLVAKTAGVTDEMVVGCRASGEDRDQHKDTHELHCRAPDALFAARDKILALKSERRTLTPVSPMEFPAASTMRSSVLARVRIRLPFASVAIFRSPWLRPIICFRPLFPCQRKNRYSALRARVGVPSKLWRNPAAVPPGMATWTLAAAAPLKRSRTLISQTVQMTG